MANTRQSRKAAHAALDAFKAARSPGDNDNPDETIIADLITDLMHLADARELSGWMVWEWARDCYEVDLEDEESEITDEPEPVQLLSFLSDFS